MTYSDLVIGDFLVLFLITLIILVLIFGVIGMKKFFNIFGFIVVMITMIPTWIWCLIYKAYMTILFVLWWPFIKLSGGKIKLPKWWSKIDMWFVYLKQ